MREPSPARARAIRPAPDWRKLFTYRLWWAEGSDAGEAEYAVNIRPDDIFDARGGSRLRVLDLVEAPEWRFRSSHPHVRRQGFASGLENSTPLPTL